MDTLSLTAAMDDTKNVKAVILAGGFGRRLRPVTKNIPKPLLPLEGSSPLETGILSLKKHGIREIHLATYYRADDIIAHFGDGSDYGVRLHYSRENTPLGTCGPLSLLRDQLTDPFLVMNGDILTTLDFNALCRFAVPREEELTVVTKEVSVAFRYGKVTSVDGRIADIQEKPELKCEVIVGVYVMKPSLFDLIPNRTYYCIDDLIKEMLEQGRPVAQYPSQAFWLDVGHVDDYRVAQESYSKHFATLKEEVG